MKKFLLVLFVVLLAAGSAYAEGTTIDVGPALATEPVSDFGSTIGGTLGVSVDFGKLIQKDFNQSDRLRFRGDISYFKWTDEESQSAFGVKEEVDVEYTRIPVFLGVRYVYPVSPTFSVFGEGGVEISFDKAEVEACVTILGNKDCSSDSDSETNTGLALGGGVKFTMSELLSISLSGRTRTVDDEYTSFAAVLGFNF